MRNKPINLSKKQINDAAGRRIRNVSIILLFLLIIVLLALSNLTVYGIRHASNKEAIPQLLTFMIGIMLVLIIAFVVYILWIKSVYQKNCKSGVYLSAVLLENGNFNYTEKNAYTRGHATYLHGEYGYEYSEHTPSKYNLCCPKCNKKLNAFVAIMDNSVIMPHIKMTAMEEAKANGWEIIDVDYCQCPICNNIVWGFHYFEKAFID